MKKKLLIYFFLASFIPLSIGAKMIFDIGNESLYEELSSCIFSQLSKYEQKQFDMNLVTDILKNIQHRMIWMMGMGLCSLVVMILFFIHHIVKPLNEVLNISKRIVEGHLDETVPVQTHDEIGKIGELINELAVNLQEVLLHVWSHTKDAGDCLEQIDKKFHSSSYACNSPQIEDDIKSVQQHISDIQEMIQAFELYDIRLKKGKIMGGGRLTVDHEEKEGGLN